MATAELLIPSDLGSDYVTHGKLTGYTWIFALDIIFAFFAAYGIGANDVANAFGTSVASRAITMRQAVLIAAVFEFVGAFFLGAQVTSTISGGIAKQSAFYRDPELLMYGMMCVDLGVAIWLWLATYLELPVSTTHSAVGGVIGMALTLKGKDAVIWNEKLVPREFPYIKGVTVIVISWVTSPLLSAIAASLIFFLVRTTVLRSAQPLNRALIAMPVIVMIAVAINIMFLIMKAGKNYGSGDIPQWQIQIYAWCSGVVAGLLVLACMPFLKKKILRERGEAEEAAKNAAEVPPAALEGEKESPKDDNDSGTHDPKDLQKSWFQRFLAQTIDHDVHSEVKHIKKVNDITDNAEKFDPDAEEAFKYLQVFTACCNSLAHGSNDVANAIGPLAAVAYIWQTGSVSKNSPVKKWVLAVGAVGIVVGLSTYGYNIIRALGLKLSKITSSRGFSVELGAATVVIVASNYGLPISTTHCLVGATVGVGAIEGVRGVNWMLFLKMIGGWLMTLVVAGGVTALFVALGAYAPSAQMSEQIRHYEDGIRARSNAFTYGFMWQAAANNATPGAVLPPQLTSAGYLRPVVPEHSADGVPTDKAYQQWKSELWSDAGVFTKTAAWKTAWEQGIGYSAPDFKGQNSSTISPEEVFRIFDKIIDFAFSPNQAAEINSVIAGDMYLCCDEAYSCCPRKCSYKKVNSDCVSKCEFVKEDPTCMEELCDELVEQSPSTASYCKLVASSDECPMPMADDSKKNYIGPKYVSNPIIMSPGDVWNATYGASYTDYREPDYNFEAKSCPPKL